MLENFGDVLKDELFLKNLSQKQVAQMLHISPQTLNSYINNHRLPDLKLFCQLINLLEIDPCKVLGITRAVPNLNHPGDKKLYEVLLTLTASQKKIMYDLALLFQKTNRMNY